MTNLPYNRDTCPKHCYNNSPHGGISVLLLPLLLPGNRISSSNQNNVIIRLAPPCAAAAAVDAAGLAGFLLTFAALIRAHSRRAFVRETSGSEILTFSVVVVLLLLPFFCDDGTT